MRLRKGQLQKRPQLRKLRTTLKRSLIKKRNRRRRKQSNKSKQIKCLTMNLVMRSEQSLQRLPFTRNKAKLHFRTLRCHLEVWLAKSKGE